MHIADTLSRAHPEQHATREDDHFDYTSAIEYVPIKSERFKKLTEATRRDTILQAVIQLVQEGCLKKNLTYHLKHSILSLQR